MPFLVFLFKVFVNAPQVFFNFFTLLVNSYYVPNNFLYCSRVTLYETTSTDCLNFFMEKPYFLFLQQTISQRIIQLFFNFISIFLQIILTFLNKYHVVRKHQSAENTVKKYIFDKAKHAAPLSQKVPWSDARLT